MPPLFEKLPLNSLPPAKDRWTPLYFEHGRIEVDDSSIKWIGADGLVCHLPVATLSCLLLGPGVSVTHAAVKACADCNTPIVWIGEEGMRFYAYGIRLLIIYSAPNCQGFSSEQINDPDYSGFSLDGLHLIASPQSSVVDSPF